MMLTPGQTTARNNFNRLLNQLVLLACGRSRSLWPLRGSSEERTSFATCRTLHGVAFASWHEESDPHRTLRKHSADHAVPTVSGDFGFLMRVSEDKSNPFVVLRYHQTRVTFCHHGQGKSTTNELYSQHILNSVMQDLAYLDYKKHILQDGPVARNAGVAGADPRPS